MRLTQEQLQPVFDEIRVLGATIKPRTELDSVVVTASTQFSFVFETQGDAATLLLCDKILDNLVIDDSYKAKLLHTVRGLRQAIEDSLPS